MIPKTLPSKHRRKDPCHMDVLSKLSNEGVRVHQKRGVGVPHGERSRRMLGIETLFAVISMSLIGGGWTGILGRNKRNMREKIAHGSFDDVLAVQTSQTELVDTLQSESASDNTGIDKWGADSGSLLNQTSMQHTKAGSENSIVLTKFRKNPVWMVTANDIRPYDFKECRKLWPCHLRSQFGIVMSKLKVFKSIVRTAVQQGDGSNREHSVPTGGPESPARRTSDFILPGGQTSRLPSRLKLPVIRYSTRKALTQAD
eukprot:758044-Hanusia_phi.AAC.5